MADFKIFQRDTSETPPLSWFTILDDGTGNYRKATLQSIIDQVPQQSVTGDGYVNNLQWTEGAKRIDLTQDGANNFNITLSGVAMQSELSSNTQRNNWNTAYGWGNHASAGYLTAESDPVFNNSAASGIDPVDIVNWNAAYAWGNHANAGYLSSVPVGAPGTRGGFRIGATDGSPSGGLQISSTDLLSVATGNGLKYAGGSLAIDLQGTSNRIAMFDPLTDSLKDSIIHESSGKIGINTTSPVHELDVYRTGTNESAINIQNGEGNVLLSIDANGHFQLTSAIGSNIILNAGSADLIRFLNLPTSAPAVSNSIWNDNGTLKITS